MIYKPCLWGLPSFRGNRRFTPFWGVNLNVNSWVCFIWIPVINTNKLMCHTIELDKVWILYKKWVIPNFENPKKGCRVKYQLLHASIIIPHYLENSLIRKKKLIGRYPWKLNPSTVYLICVLDYLFRKHF